MAGLFSFFGGKRMDEFVEEARATEGSVIIDVRSENEFVAGHVEGAVNIPVGDIESIVSIIPDKQTPLFVHCLSGARSATATRALKRMGYDNITDMGGIGGYRGKLVRN